MLAKKPLLLLLLCELPLWCGLFWLHTTPPLTAYGLSYWTLSCLLGSFALIAAAIDLQTKILPDIWTLWCPLPCIAAMTGLLIIQTGTAGLITTFPLHGALLGFFLLKGLQLLLRKQYNKELIGSGDTKLMLGLGALTGPFGLLPTLFLALLLACAVFLCKKTKKIPFGQSLVLAALAVVLLDVYWP